MREIAIALSTWHSYWAGMDFYRTQQNLHLHQLSAVALLAPQQHLKVFVVLVQVLMSVLLMFVMMLAMVTDMLQS